MKNTSNRFATLCFFVVSVGLAQAQAETQLQCEAPKDMPSHNLRTDLTVKSDILIAVVEVSLFDARSGEYKHLVGSESVTASEFKPKDPMLAKMNRFVILKSHESTYTIYLPKNLSELVSAEGAAPVEALLRVSFDEGKPFTDKLECVLIR